VKNHHQTNKQTTKDLACVDISVLYSGRGIALTINESRV
jgi:hypothetical protein